MEKVKNCFRCGAAKPLSEFYKHPQMPDGTVNKCKECNKEDNKKNRIKKIRQYQKYDQDRYRMSVERLKKQKYKGIKDRCEDKHRHRKYTVSGMEYLSWEEYLKWWKDNEVQFARIYYFWMASGFRNKLAPSIDRIDETKGYHPNNMQWLTLSENCSKRFKQ